MFKINKQKIKQKIKQIKPVCHFRYTGLIFYLKEEDTLISKG